MLQDLTDVQHHVLERDHDHLTALQRETSVLALGKDDLYQNVVGLHQGVENLVQEAKFLAHGYDGPGQEAKEDGHILEAEYRDPEANLGYQRGVILQEVGVPALKVNLRSVLVVLYQEPEDLDQEEDHVLEVVYQAEKKLADQGLAVAKGVIDPFLEVGLLALKEGLEVMIQREARDPILEVSNQVLRELLDQGLEVKYLM